MCNKVLCYHTSSCIHVLCVLKTFSFLKSKYWKGTAIISFPLFSKYLNVNITEQNSTCKKQLFVLWVITGKFVEVICQHFTCFLVAFTRTFFFLCVCMCCIFINLIIYYCWEWEVCQKPAISLEIVNSLMQNLLTYMLSSCQIYILLWCCSI